MHGFVLLDKPLGLSSNHAVQRVRRLYGGVKAGHAGTLDPAASGMLPIALGAATKVVGHLIAADKAYRARVRLGVRTTTADAEGEVLEQRPVPPLDLGTVETALARFRGAIEQVPPMYAACKHAGERLYRLARRGLEVPRPARPVHIHRLECVQVEQDTLELYVECSKGTYIRSLAEDLGGVLGCGAHLSALHRIWVDPFRSAPLYPLAQLEACTVAERAAVVLPLRAALPNWPLLRLDDRAAAAFGHGQTLPVAEPDGEVWVEGVDGVALGLGRIVGGRLRVLRGFRS